MRRVSCWTAGVLASVLVVNPAGAQSKARPGFLPGTEQNVARQPAVETTSVAIPLDGAFAERLKAVDETLAKAGTPEEIARCSLQEADILTELAGTLPEKDRPAVVRQIADCLAGPAAYDATARTRLLALEKQLAQDAPGSALAAYVTYREIGVGEEGVVQAVHRHDRLANFVTSYPESKESQVALVELATSSERSGKNEEARIWYTKLATSPEARLARQAKGALRCLNLEGKVLRLALPLLLTADESKDVPFDIEDLRGRIVMVYFWSSSQEYTGDLECLRKIAEQHRASGVELLCVNVDSEPGKVRESLRDSKAPGIHVFQRGGLEGTVPQRTGITSAPHIILVGRDGVVLRHNVEIGALDEQVKRAVAASGTVRGGTE